MGLTARERIGLFLIDEQPDRVPVMPLITAHAAATAGMTVREYCTDGSKMARAHLAAWKQYDHDAMMVFSDVGMVAEAFGSRYSFPDNNVPELLQPVIQDVDQVADLRIDDAETPARWGVYYQAIEELYTQAGDRIPILAFVPAPFTSSAGIRGTEDFLADLIIDPEKALELLQKSLEGVIMFLDGVMQRGALPVLVDPLASSSVISPRQFRTFALPFLETAVGFLHRFDMDVILHICGRTAPILNDIRQTGADLFSLDDTPLSDACVTLGDDIRLIGNITPANLLTWKPGRIADEVIKLLNTARNTPKGFALSTGCEVPIETPVENLQALIQTGKQHGKYW